MAAKDKPTDPEPQDEDYDSNEDEDFNPEAAPAADDDVSESSDSDEETETAAEAKKKKPKSKPAKRPAPADEEELEELRRTGGGERMIKRYTVYRQQHNLLRSLEELTRASSKRMSKKDRKAVHHAFQDVLNTVEKPTRGPRYSTALDEDGREYGSRLRVSIHGGGKMLIDKWWKLLRLTALRRALQGGFAYHYEHNDMVSSALPFSVGR